MGLRGVNGAALATATAGAVFVWSGLKGRSVTQVLRELAGGKQPSAAADYPIVGEQAAVIGAATGAALGQTGGPTPSQFGALAGAGGSVAAVVAYAYAQLGKPYAWGGAGPGSFDCSGLTMMAWRQAGVKLAHFAATQYATTHRVTRAQLQPGDIVFFFGLDHCGLYIGNDQFIQAPHTGDVVKISKLSTYPAYVGAGRP